AAVRDVVLGLLEQRLADARALRGRIDRDPVQIVAAARERYRSPSGIADELAAAFREDERIAALSPVREPLLEDLARDRELGRVEDAGCGDKARERGDVARVRLAAKRQLAAG